MLLSIGMIVKNEEKYLEKCLSALKPILENIDSELIIADTGSTDRTVEIAKKFTDKVLYFEWVKDFSAARNFTMDNSTGEWYMFIDADEVLTSCDEIIEFFKSGEYKKYNTATYIVRNYADETLTSYSDFTAPRLTRHTKDVHFVNPIHEVFDPFRLPVKHFITWAEHYGYFFGSEEEHKAKFKRNTELLLNRLKAETDPDMILYLQLFQGFISFDEESALKYLEEGIEKCLQKKDHVAIPLYMEKIALLYNEEKWQQVIDVCDKYFQFPEAIRPGVISADAEFYAFKASALKQLGNNKDAIAEYMKFFPVYNEVISGRLVTVEMMMSGFKFASPSNYGKLLYYFLECCIEEGKYSSAMQVLKTADISDCYNDPKNIHAQLNQEFTIMRHTEYKRAKALYSQLNEQGQEVYRAFVRREIADAENKAAVIAVFKKILKDNGNFSVLLEAYSSHYLNSDSSAETAELIKNASEYSEPLYFLLSEKKDISPFIKSGNYDIKETTALCCSCFSDFYSAAENYPLNIISDPSVLEAMLEIYETTMLSALNSQRDIQKLFICWGRLGSELCRMKEISPEQTDGITFAAAYADKITADISAKELRACAADMTALIRKYPQAKPIIIYIRDSITKQEQPVSKADEMAALAAALKNNIRSLIAAGKTDEARHIFEEYIKINPGDREITALRQELY